MLDGEGGGEEGEDIGLRLSPCWMEREAEENQVGNGLRAGCRKEAENHGGGRSQNGLGMSPC